MLFPYFPSSNLGKVLPVSGDPLPEVQDPDSPPPIHEVPKGYPKPLSGGEAVVNVERAVESSASMLIDLWAEAYRRISTANPDELRDLFPVKGPAQELEQDATVTQADVAIALELLRRSKNDFAAAAAQVFAGLSGQATPLDAKTLAGLVDVSVNEARYSLGLQSLYIPQDSGLNPDGTSAPRWKVVSDLSNGAINAVWSGMGALAQLLQQLDGKADLLQSASTWISQVINDAIAPILSAGATDDERKLAAEAVHDLKGKLVQQLEVVFGTSLNGVAPGVTIRGLVDRAFAGVPMLNREGENLGGVYEFDINTLAHFTAADVARAQGVIDLWKQAPSQDGLPSISKLQQILKTATAKLTPEQRLAAGAALASDIPTIAESLVKASPLAANLSAGELAERINIMSSRIALTLLDSGIVPPTPEQKGAIVVLAKLISDIDAAYLDGDAAIKTLLSVGNLSDIVSKFIDESTQLPPEISSPAQRAFLKEFLVSNRAGLFDALNAGLPFEGMTAAQRAQFRQVLDAEIALLDPSLPPGLLKQHTADFLNTITPAIVSMIESDPPKVSLRDLTSGLAPAVDAWLAKLEQSVPDAVERAEIVRQIKAQLAVRLGPLTDELIPQMSNSGAVSAGELKQRLAEVFNATLNSREEVLEKSYNNVIAVWQQAFRDNPFASITTLADPLLDALNGPPPLTADEFKELGRRLYAGLNDIVPVIANAMPGASLPRALDRVRAGLVEALDQSGARAMSMEERAIAAFARALGNDVRALFTPEGLPRLSSFGEWLGRIGGVADQVVRQLTSDPAQGAQLRNYLRANSDTIFRAMSAQWPDDALTEAQRNQLAKVFPAEMGIAAPGFSTPTDPVQLQWQVLQGQIGVALAPLLQGGATADEIDRALASVVEVWIGRVPLDSEARANLIQGVQALLASRLGPLSERLALFLPQGSSLSASDLKQHIETAINTGVETPQPKNAADHAETILDTWADLLKGSNNQTDIASLTQALLDVRNGPPPLTDEVFTAMGGVLRTRLEQFSTQFSSDPQTIADLRNRLTIALEQSGAVPMSKDRRAILAVSGDLVSYVAAALGKGEQGFQELLAFGILGQQVSTSANARVDRLFSDSAERTRMKGVVHANSAQLFDAIIAQLPAGALTPAQRTQLASVLKAEVAIMPASFDLSRASQWVDLQAQIGQTLVPLIQGGVSSQADIQAAIAPFIQSALHGLSDAAVRDALVYLIQTGRGPLSERLAQFLPAASTTSAVALKQNISAAIDAAITEALLPGTSPRYNEVIANWENFNKQSPARLMTADDFLSELNKMKTGVPPLTDEELQALAPEIQSRLREISAKLIDQRADSVGLSESQRARRIELLASRIDDSLRLSGAIPTGTLDRLTLHAAAGMAAHIDSVAKSAKGSITELLQFGELSRRLIGQVLDAASKQTNGPADRARFLQNLQDAPEQLLEQIVARLHGTTLSSDQIAAVKNMLAAEIKLVPPGFARPKDPLGSFLTDLQQSAGKALQTLLKTSPPDFTPAAIENAVLPAVKQLLSELPPATDPDSHLARAKLLQDASNQLNGSVDGLVDWLLTLAPVSQDTKDALRSVLPARIQSSIRAGLENPHAAHLVALWEQAVATGQLPTEEAMLNMLNRVKAGPPPLTADQLLALAATVKVRSQEIATRVVDALPNAASLTPQERARLLTQTADRINSVMQVSGVQPGPTQNQVALNTAREFTDQIRRLLEQGGADAFQQLLAFGELGTRLSKSALAVAQLAQPNDAAARSALLKQLRQELDTLATEIHRRLPEDLLTPEQLEQLKAVLGQEMNLLPPDFDMTTEVAQLQIAVGKAALDAASRFIAALPEDGLFQHVGLLPESIFKDLDTIEGQLRPLQWLPQLDAGRAELVRQVLARTGALEQVDPAARDMVGDYLATQLSKAIHTLVHDVTQVPSSLIGLDPAAYKMMDALATVYEDGLAQGLKGVQLDAYVREQAKNLATGPIGTLWRASPNAGTQADKNYADIVGFVSNFVAKRRGLDSAATKDLVDSMMVSTGYVTGTLKNYDPQNLELTRAWERDAAWSVPILNAWRSGGEKAVEALLSSPTSLMKAVPPQFIVDYQADHVRGEAEAGKQFGRLNALLQGLPLSDSVRNRLIPTIMAERYIASDVNALPDNQVNTFIKDVLPDAIKLAEADRAKNGGVGTWNLSPEGGVAITAAFLSGLSDAMEGMTAEQKAEFLKQVKANPDVTRFPRDYLTALHGWAGDQNFDPTTLGAELSKSLKDAAEWMEVGVKIENLLDEVKAKREEAARKMTPSGILQLFLMLAQALTQLHASITKEIMRENRRMELISKITEGVRQMIASIAEADQKSNTLISLANNTVGQKNMDLLVDMWAAYNELEGQPAVDGKHAFFHWKSWVPVMMLRADDPELERRRREPGFIEVNEFLIDKVGSGDLKAGYFNGKDDGYEEKDVNKIRENIGQGYVYFQDAELYRYILPYGGGPKNTDGNGWEKIMYNPQFLGSVQVKTRADAEKALEIFNARSENINRGQQIRGGNASNVSGEVSALYDQVNSILKTLSETSRSIWSRLG